jgi:hypothetical protein
MPTVSWSRHEFTLPWLRPGPGRAGARTQKTVASLGLR